MSPERFAHLLSSETCREQAAIARRSGFYRELRLEEYIAQVLSALVPLQLPEGVTPRVVLVNDVDVNAYSFPDGGIYIHTGLLALLENEAELALLLAHELAHATRQHALRALLADQAMKNLAVENHEPFNSGMASKDLTAWFGSVEPSDAMGSIRRGLESEADQVALKTLIGAGYDLEQALGIFIHSQDEKQTTQAAEREQEMRAALAVMRPGGSKREMDRQAFSDRLQNLLLDQGWRELRHGRPDAGLRCARRLVGTSEAGAAGHFLIGEIFRQRNHPGDQQLALSHYHLSIASDSSFGEPHKAIGLIYLKQGQARLARGFFETALALAPEARDTAYIQDYLTQSIARLEGGEL